MVDPSFRLRAGSTEQQVTGTPGNVLTFQSDGTVAGEAPGGGVAEPIQQVRWLDLASLASPNGSIGAPFIDPADFFAEVAGSGGWTLMLPGDAAGDFSIPDVGGVPVVLVGVSSTASSIGSIPVAAQGESEPFPPLQLTLRDLASGTISFGGGPLALVAENCALSQVEATGGTLTGGARFVNCALVTVNLPDVLQDWQSCTIGDPAGSASAQNVLGGTFRNCKFLNAVQFRFFDAVTMYDCEFGSDLSLICNASQSLTCDPTTYARLIAAVPNHPDTTPTYLPVPRLLQQQQIGLLNGAIIPAASITTFNLGQPPADPPALPAGLAQVMFLGQPGSTVVCVGATISGGGDILVDVLNTSDLLTAAVDDGQLFVVFYEPGTSLA